MSKRHPWLLVVGILLFCSAAFAAEVLPSSKVTVNDYPHLPYAVTGPAFKLPSAWRFYNGDAPEYSSADFDDAGWQTMQVGQEKPGDGWRWYRASFTLPSELQNRDLLFDLGRVSVYEEVFVNGVQVGHFGNPPPYFLHGATGVWRKYPIAAKHFKPGRNVIAIRVHLGHRGGLYQGPYTLQALDNNSIAGKMSLKTSGIYALETLLTETAHLNIYSPGERILVGPELVQLFGSTAGGRINAKIVDSGDRVVVQDAVALPLNEMEWARPLFRFTAPQQMATYRCVLAYEAGGKTLWERELRFKVIDNANRAKFEPKVDEMLAGLEDVEFPVRVDSAAVGHFGPRDLTPELTLFEDVEATDARSGMAYSIQTRKAAGGPRLFLGNVRPVPEDADKVGRLHRAAGHNFDGLPDAWIYGYVRPNRTGPTEEMAVRSTSWAKRTYRYEYQNKDWMEYSVSAISPAWQANSNSQKLRVFDEIGRHGIGLPTHLAYESNGQVKVVDAETGVRGRDMSANWILAWFNGGKNWNEFDTPYLFVLEKRPDLVETYGNAALFFNNTNGVGTVQGMPLYGVTLQSLERTARWANGLPPEVQERCRFWSRVLVNAPDEVKRTARVDYDADQLVVKDEFTYRDVQDDWKTRGLKIAPVSTLLALSAASGNLDIAVSKPARDLEMATLQGPLLAAESADTMLFRVNGVLHYIREVRDVKISENAQSDPVRSELNRIVAGGLQSELSKHPWASTVRGGELIPGRQRVTYTNLLLTLPYLDPALRAEVEKEIRAETEKYFLRAGAPDAELAAKLEAELKDQPLIGVITNPVTGLKFGVPTLKTKFGIDQTYFSSLNIYMAWLYADTFERAEWIKENYPALKLYFNMARNSHDWTIGVSWDTFSGLRVGNGLQEGGGIYAGMVGMARAARAIGDEATSDTASYYAVMQVVGMQGQLAASEYLKQRRPWLGSHTKQNDIEYVQKIRPYYFAELNEFAGLSQSIIGTQNSGSSPGGFIESPLPEIMRLYQEVWPEFTNEFYDPKYDKIIQTDRRLDDRLSLDAFVYQVTRYPQSPQQVFEVRKKIDQDWWSKLPDYRALLDSRGKIGYRKLW